MEKKSVWEGYSAAEKKKAFDFAAGYEEFLSNAKIEREVTEYVINDAEAHGYKEFRASDYKRKKLKAGDKVYFCNMNKGVVMFNIGTRPLSDGMAILGAHIDSPRLDIKQIPFYEDGGMAYMDTHYYGGIKKYQWVTIPLALHGVVVKKDGTTVVVNIGEDDDDPVFFISDLLIHLASEQMKKDGAKVVEGEALDIIAGNMPIKLSAAEEKKPGAAKEKIKKNVLDILLKEYGITEDDFESAEIEVVPAGKARDAGFDRSLVLAYGHDDKVCTYPSYKAMFEVEKPSLTSCCVLVDKEEIGSVGATGMQSRFFENCVAELTAAMGDYSELEIRRTLANSFMLSSDVTAGFDPTYASVFDKKNAAYMGMGFSFNKFTGSRGKSGSNDANAEYLGAIRRVMDKAKVRYQMGELGAVDAGGGGTIAYIMALYGMNVIDCGVPVLNMHAPHEAISKADLYEVYKAYIAFLKDIGNEKI